MLISAGDQHHWRRVCNALGKPEWLEEPRFSARHERLNNAELVNQAIRELLADRTMEQAIAHFTEHDVVAATVNIGTTPQVGEHNEEVLQGILGYSEEWIESFREGRVISEEHYYDEIPG